MQNRPRNVPQAARLPMISRIGGLGGCSLARPRAGGAARSHGAIHARLRNPTIQNSARQPMCETISPPMSVPKVGPSFVPASMSALARPR